MKSRFYLIIVSRVDCVSISDAVIDSIAVLVPKLSSLRFSQLRITWVFCLEKCCELVVRDEARAIGVDIVEGYLRSGELVGNHHVKLRFINHALVIASRVCDLAALLKI